jgi:hypothetical protein
VLREHKSLWPMERGNPARGKAHLLIPEAAPHLLVMLVSPFLSLSGPLASSRIPLSACTAS